LAKKKAALEKACGQEVHLISGVSGAGIDTVLRAMAKEIRARRKPKTVQAIKAAKEKWVP
jgi:GTP-binding protein